MPSFYLNTYIPLVANKRGREVSQRMGIDPFVDGSIRREPDFEHEFPAITCLCRADKFAPRLQPGDVVAYMLRKGRYGLDHPQRRLTAVLRVLDTFPTHAAGAAWYEARNLPLPSNCWVPGNAAQPLDRSHNMHKIDKSLSPEEIHRVWDTRYRARARRFGTFVVCERLFHDLSWQAPEISEPVLRAVFGSIPGTRNPGRWPITQGERLFSLLSLNIPLSAP